MDDLSLSQKSRDAAFSFLLQPIRDLAKNWDVDIASTLEEYLDELSQITISFDGGETNLNFAEAALLIQGSTCVYSKKVENLYTLVFETLELISKRKKMKSKNHSLTSGEESILFDDHPAFLLLDFDEGKNLNLPSKHRNKQAEDANLSRRLSRLSVASNISLLSNSLLLNSSALSLTHHSSSFNASSSHHSGLGVGGEKDELASIAGQLNVTNYSVHEETGHLLIPSVSRSLQAHRSGEFMPPTHSVMQFASDPLLEDHHDDNNHDNDGWWDQGNEHDFGMEEEEEDKEEDFAHAMGFRRPNPFSSSSTSQAVAKKKAQKVLAWWERSDVWKPLNPDESVGTSALAKHFQTKPIKRSKVKRHHRLLRGRREKEEERKEEMEAAEQRGTLSRSFLFQERLPATLTPFAQSLRQARKRQNTQQHHHQEEEERGGEEDEDAWWMGGADLNHNQDEDEEDFGDFDHQPSIDFDGDFDTQVRLAPGFSSSSHADEALASALSEAPSTYEAMCKRLLGEVSKKVDRWVRSDEVEKRVDMWREKIQPLLEEEERREAFDIHRQGDEILSVLASFSDQDQDQEQEHSLSQIVTACYQHHQEQEEQQQKQGKGGEKNNSNNNRPLVLTPRVEACRNFVAALQLACFGNVELVQDESNDDLVVRRLEDGQERPQEALLAYRAPSAMVEN